MEAVCNEDQGKLILENGIIRRVFSTEGAFRTVNLTFLRDGRNLVVPPANFEAITPWGHGDEVKEKKPPAPCREVEISLDGKTASLGLGEGFKYESHDLKRKEDSLTLRVKFVPLLAEWQGLELELYLTIYDNEPFFIKWIKLINNSDKTVTVTGCKPEVLRMPTAGDVSYMREITRTAYPMGRPNYASDQVREPFACSTGYTPPKNDPVIYVDHSTQKTELFGFSLITDYVFQPPSIGANGQEILTQFPEGPNMRVSPGGDFESFRTYFVLFEGDLEDGSLAFRRMIRKVCPWTKDFVVMFAHTYWRKSHSEKVRSTGIFDPSPLYRSIDQAAETGFDVWMFDMGLWPTTWGDFEPRPEFPNGVSDMRQVSDYAHSKGLKVNIHTSDDYALDRNKHPLTDESGKCVSVDIGVHTDCLKRHANHMTRDKDGKQRDVYMCGCSGWHDYMLKKALPFYEAIDLDLIDPDGAEGHSIMCYAKDHPHASPEESQYMNWKLNYERFKLYREKGWIVQAPGGVSSLFRGNSTIHTYTREISSYKDVYDLALATRKDLYRGSLYVPNTADNYFLALNPNVMLDFDIFKKPERIDYYFASIACYGVTIVVSGESVYETEEAKQIISRWLALLHAHHDILCRDIIHLAPVTGKNIDAIMHVADRGATRGFLAAFNPTRSVLTTRLVIPGKHVGNIDRLMMRDLKTGLEIAIKPDRAGNFLYDVEILPLDYSLALALAPET